MRRPRRRLVVLTVGVALAVIAGLVFLVTRPDASPLRVVVLSDSLSEGMGEVTDLSRTWPNLVGDALRTDRRQQPGSGGTWMPASLAGDMFGFSAGRADAAAWAATDDTGVPGAIARGPVTWDVRRYDSAVVHVAAEWAGARFTARSGDRVVGFTSTGPGTASFVVDDLGDELTVSGDGVVLGVLGRSGGGTVEVYNLSWSGSSTNDWLGWAGRPMLLPMLRAIDPDVIVLSLGGNDFWDVGDTDRFGAHLGRLHGLVSGVAPRARWVLGTQPVPAATDAAAWRRFQQVTIDTANGLGAPVIDLVGQMPTAAEAPGLYSSDRTHLTDAGHAFIAERATPAIRRALG
ncbi:MAG: SGNH/GDSL hydrolase family protein [Micropruina sp.]|nr:SGNH/GDSL hydrolase family protein [Micropruina sp.]